LSHGIYEQVVLNQTWGALHGESSDAASWALKSPRDARNKRCSWWVPDRDASDMLVLPRTSGAGHGSRDETGEDHGGDGGRLLVAVPFHDTFGSVFAFWGHGSRQYDL
jgi:hypothetical protein